MAREARRKCLEDVVYNLIVFSGESSSASPDAQAAEMIALLEDVMKRVSIRIATQVDHQYKSCDCGSKKREVVKEDISWSL